MTSTVSNYLCVDIPEIMHRLPQATFAVRQCLLAYVLPWLYNMELVEPSVLSTATNTDSLSVHNSKHLPGSSDTQPALLKGRGWGSPEATDMILNNLLYTTLTVSSFVKLCSLGGGNFLFQ